MLCGSLKKMREKKLLEESNNDCVLEYKEKNTDCVGRQKEKDLR